MILPLLLLFALPFVARGTPRRSVVMGFNPALIRAAAGNPRTARIAAQLVRRYGPRALRVAATVYPPAAVALKAADALQKRAQRGDPAALRKIAAVRAGAAQGNAQAQASATLLRSATAAKRAAVAEAAADEDEG